MTAIRFAMSHKEHTESPSSFDYLDSLVVRSYKAKNGSMVP